jgi:hypothetical protein
VQITSSARLSPCPVESLCAWGGPLSWLCVGGPAFFLRASGLETCAGSSQGLCRNAWWWAV